MKFLNDIEALCWHDGVFLEVKTTVTTAMTIQLWVELYKDNDSAARAKIGFDFDGVENLVFTASTQELLENAPAGNINYAYIKPLLSNHKHRFTLYLIDGIISFDFDDAKVLENF